MAARLHSSNTLIAGMSAVAVSTESTEERQKELQAKIQAT